MEEQSAVVGRGRKAAKIGLQKGVKIFVHKLNSTKVCHVL